MSPPFQAEHRANGLRPAAHRDSPLVVMVLESPSSLWARGPDKHRGSHEADTFPSSPPWSASEKTTLRSYDLRAFYWHQAQRAGTDCPVPPLPTTNGHGTVERWNSDADGTTLSS